MSPIKKSILLAAAAVTLFLSGCTFVEVQNLSDLNARVLVRTPDSGSGYTRLVGSGEVASVFSGYGGRYTVTTLPNEAYRNLLIDLQAEISRRLFEERATLSGAEVARLVTRIQEISTLLDDLAQKGASCAGNVPDFESALVVLVWDEQANNWEMTCG